MAHITLIIPVSKPSEKRLKALVKSLQIQTHDSWVAYFLVDAQSSKDIVLVSNATGSLTNAHTVTHLKGTSLSAIIKDIPWMGSWFGLVSQDAVLEPEALEHFNDAITESDEYHVIYSDEQSRTYFGHTSLASAKGMFDPVKLLSHNYLGNLTLFRSATVETLGGLDPICNQDPAHDLALRVLDTSGPRAFKYIPLKMYSNFRRYMEVLPSPHRKVRYDPQAIKNSLKRRSLTGTVKEYNGTPKINFSRNYKDSVTAVVFLGGGGTDELHTLRSLHNLKPRPNTFFQILYANGSENEAEILRTCRSLGYRVASVPLGMQDLVNWTNNHDSLYTLVLMGAVVSPDLVDTLLDWVVLPSVGAVMPKMIRANRLHYPGMPSHPYNDWDWNTRGKHNAMVVPHRSTGLSVNCFMLKTAALNQYPLDVSKGALMGEDLAQKLAAGGLLTVEVPTVTVLSRTLEASQEDFSAMWGSWPSWNY
ncbi:MAG: hypothetical protein ACOH2T_19280 [Pseudomonas sp.]